ncbi:MAG: response regulator [Myxococcota bacterium]
MRAHVTIPIALTFALIGVGIYLYFPRQQEDAGTRALGLKASRLAELAAYAIAPAVEFDDEALIAEVFRGAASDPELQSIAAFRGGVMLSAYPEDAEVEYQGEAAETLVYFLPGQVCVEVPIPSATGEPALLLASYSTATIDHASQRNRWVAVGIGLAIFLVGLILALRIDFLFAAHRRARHRAEEASRAKSQFLANMSHEIRTPLNGILGMATLLLHKRLPEEERRYAQSIERSGHNLLRLVNDILDFSKVEAGRFELEEAPFSLVQRLDNVVDAVAKSASDKGVELVAHLAPDVPTGLVGDGLRVEQILMNLVGNAVKFTDEGEIFVHGKVASRDESEVRVRFEVRDTGIGMTPEQQRRVFEAFTQADVSMARRFGGSGLGLTIVRHLVERMKGTLELESEAGKGTTFIATIPFAISGEGDAPAGWLQDRKLLVVDDNATNRLVLREQISAWGGSAEAVEGPQSALAALDEASFDIIVLDFHMPEMNGLELAQAIRKRENAPLMVMLSSVETTAREIREAGIAAYANKPIVRRTFERALRTALGEGAPEAAPMRIEKRNRGTLLVAEDNATNREVISSLLAVIGFDSQMVENGAQAVEAARDADVRAILMDCQMPVMDGYAATRAIREEEQAGGRARMPIIAVTAHALPEEQERATEAGMDAYVTKPVSLGALDEALSNLLEEDPAVVRNSMVPPSVDQVLDPGALDTLRELGVFDRVVGTYRDDAHGLLEAMQQALVDLDADGLRRAAHTLKGASRYVGAVQVAALAEAIEHGASEGELAEAEMQTLELEDVLLQAMSGLEAEMEGANVGTQI